MSSCAIRLRISPSSIEPPDVRLKYCFARSSRLKSSFSVMDSIEDISVRSCLRSSFATSHPLLSSPTRFSFGTLTLSKKVWQNSDSPLINSIGLTDTPSLAISISKKLIPCCLGADGSVRTRQNIQSALCALVVHILVPFTKKWSPISSAFVFRLARSEPAPGSEYPCAQRISPFTILGICSCFCASLPYASRAGPNIQTPISYSGGRHFNRAISCCNTLASSIDRPPPPYSFGQVGAVQPRSAIASNQLWASADGNTRLRPPHICSLFRMGCL